MRTITIPTLMAGLAVLMAVPEAGAQSPDLQQKLKDQYTLTKLSDDRQQVITAGAVLILKVDGTALVPMSAAADTSGNTYKSGDSKVTQGTVGKSNEVAKKVGSIINRIPLGPKPPMATNVDTRKFVAGEKVNVTKITVNPDRSVAFELASFQAYTDANIYYRGTLTFTVAKGAPAMTDEKVVSTVAEVFSVAPADTKTESQPAAGAGQGQTGQAQGQAPPQSGPSPAPPAQAQPPQAQQYADIAPPAPPAETAQTSKYADIPPPPPPPAAPRKLEKGMTVAQVKAGYGEPESIVDLGPKVIYKYKDLKITFTNGKISDVE